jgi:hypothetical protein
VASTLARPWTKDLIYTTTDIREDYQGQYFWEAFPAGSGPTDRTTYMFTYMDADPSRPTLVGLSKRR